MLKKSLLTTALVGLSSVAFADMAVEVGGNVEFQAGMPNQAKAYRGVAAANTNATNGKRQGDVKFVTKSKIHVKAHAKNDAGFMYGAQINLEDKTNNSVESLKIRKSFVFLDSAMGRLELGGNDGASRTMKIGAENIARGTGGIDGSALDYVEKNVGYIATNGSRVIAPYHTAPQLPGDNGSDTAKMNKVTFYTPDFNGLKFGVSYAPDTQINGGLGSLKDSKLLGTAPTASAGDAAAVAPGYTNIVTGGVSYNYNMDNVAVKLAVTGQTGDAKHYINSNNAEHRFHDLKAMSVGGSLTFSNFTVAGSYADLGKSGNTVEKDEFNTLSSKFHTVGVSVNQGPFAASITSFSSKKMGNELDLHSVSADYNYANGALGYIEFTNFKFKPHSKASAVNNAATPLATKNNGHVVLIGTKVSF